MTENKVLSNRDIEKAVIRTLECSAELLSKPGKWIRGAEKLGYGEKARFCAIGAVREVTTKLHLPDFVRTRAVHHLDMTVLKNNRVAASSIVSYNDDYAKSAQSVVRVMEKTIDRLKKKKNMVT